MPHGISLSLGGAERPDPARLEALARLAVRFLAPMVSEHIAFVRAGGVETGHLLPLPRTRDALDVLVANVCEAQSALPVPLALENIAALVEWPEAEMDEAQFLTELLERTGAGSCSDPGQRARQRPEHGVSSRAGGQAANLQGIWNEEVIPNWGSKYTININTEMNYWPAEVCNLSECAQPLFDMVKDISVTGQETAKTYYGVNGWVTHHNIDLWRGTAPVDAARFGMWPVGGAWLCQSVWEHYAFTGDTNFLKEYYPVLKGAAQFLLEVMVGLNRNIIGWSRRSQCRRNTVIMTAMEKCPISHHRRRWTSALSANCFRIASKRAKF